MTHAFTRRQFGTLAAGGIALALPSRHVFAQAGEIKLKYGTAFPADHPGTLRIKEAAEAIRKDTGGKVDFQVYPTSQLGSEPDMISQTRAGAIDFMSTAGTNLQTLVPTAGINGVAFAFKDYATVWAAMDGDVGAHVRTALAKVNLHVFDKCLDNGYRNITSATKAINTPDDLKGFKIRVPGIPLWLSMFKALGAAPTAIPFGELYSALQTKVVDGSICRLQPRCCCRTCALSRRNGSLTTPRATVRSSSQLPRRASRTWCAGSRRWRLPSCASSGLGIRT